MAYSPAVKRAGRAAPSSKVSARGVLPRAPVSSSSVNVPFRWDPVARWATRSAPKPAAAGAGDRGLESHGSKEVREDWRDEWVSGNPSIEQNDAFDSSNVTDLQRAGESQPSQAASASHPQAGQGTEVPEHWKDEWASGNQSASDSPSLKQSSSSMGEQGSDPKGGEGSDPRMSDWRSVAESEVRKESEQGSATQSGSDARGADGEGAAAEGAGVQDVE